MGAVAECEVSLGDLSGDGGDDDADKPSDDGDDSSEGDGTYGSDPELDELWDACEDGDWEACDDLYMQSDVGSEYERSDERRVGKECVCPSRSRWSPSPSKQ